MKTIKNIFLLVTLLCLAGCSSEDPQSVSFSVNELRFDRKSSTVIVGIIANCPWVITGDDDFVVTNLSEGVGSGEIAVTVWRNESYEDRSHTIYVQSKDGKSSAGINVYQEANVGLKMEKPETVASEGGVFHMSVETNDEITTVETPEWITFTASRALTGYTYTFTAKPNKTGAPRKAPIRLRGKNLTDYVHVTQDSYTPTGVVLEELPEYIFVGENVVFGVTAEPEYADNSKISVEVLFNGKKMKNTFENGKLQFYPTYKGEYTLEFYEGATLLHSTKLEAFNSDVHMTLSCKESCLVGDTINVKVDIPLEICTIETTDNQEALEKIDETTYIVKKEGGFSFTATNNLTGQKDKSSVNAKLAISKSWAECGSTTSDGKVLTTFYTDITSNFNMTFSHVSIFGPDGNLVMKNNAFVTLGGTYILIKSYEFPAEKGKYTIWVELSIGGETKSIVSSVTF